MLIWMFWQKFCIVSWLFNVFQLSLLLMSWSPASQKTQWLCPSLMIIRSRLVRLFFPQCWVCVISSFECKYNIELSLFVRWSTMLSLFRGYLMNMWRRAGITLSQEHWKVKHLTIIKHIPSAFLEEDTMLVLFSV